MSQAFVRGSLAVYIIMTVHAINFLFVRISLLKSFVRPIFFGCGGDAESHGFPLIIFFYYFQLEEIHRYPIPIKALSLPRNTNVIIYDD